MKWDAFIGKDSDHFVPGDWNVIDDMTGMKVKASQTVKQWDGFRTTKPRPRHPQDFLRSVPEKTIPWGRTEQTDTYVETTNNMLSSQPTTSYASGNIRFVNGISYTANQTHTSGLVFDLDRSKWDIT